MRNSGAVAKITRVFGGALAACVIAATSMAQGADPGLEAADHSFVQAVSRSDRVALVVLLDRDFTWTDVNGKSETFEEIRRPLQGTASPPAAMATPVIADESKAQVEYRAYGPVASVQVHSDRQHALRIWVRRPAGWRALVYQEVQLRDTPPSTAAAPGAECINPCRSIPYQAKTDNERAVATAFSALETSVMAHDADKWASLIGDEFEAFSSGNDKLLDKKTRRAELARASMAGLAPVPLVSARMTEVGDAIVMESQHQPLGGKPLHATRLWVKRGAGWVEVVSYQTTIQAAPAAR